MVVNIMKKCTYKVKKARDRFYIVDTKTNKGVRCYRDKKTAYDIWKIMKIINRREQGTIAYNRNDRIIDFFYENTHPHYYNKRTVSITLWKQGSYDEYKITLKEMMNLSEKEKFDLAEKINSKITGVG